MNTLLHLQAVGVLLLALAAINVFVPRRFNWKQEMASLSLLNRQIVLVHSGFIILLLVLLAALLLGFADELLIPTLARAILAGLTLFWFARLLTQWLVYDWRIWRGHRFNTIMHVVFTVLWIYFTMTFAYALWLNYSSGQTAQMAYN